MTHGGGTAKVVGREAELRVLAGAIARAAEGSPSVVLIAGEAGIGKTTLVMEAARRADVPAYLGRCVHVGGDSIPLAPLVDLFRQIERRPPRADGEAPDLPAVAHFLQPSASGGRHDLSADVLRVVGELSADGVVLLGVEDLHWGDAATWDHFELVARNLGDERVVVIATYRPNELAADPVLRRRLAELSRQRIVERITLEGLDRNAVAVHAADILGIPAPPALVDEVVRRGQGNPFFTAELVGAHLAGEQIPPLLSDLLAADIAGMTQEARYVVGALAAIGRDADADLLAHVVELDVRATEQAVRAAVDARLVVIDPVTDAYRVRHPLIGEVAYAGLLPSERKRLHRAIADALAADPRFGVTAMDAAGELALHLHRAGDLAGAFVASLAAAEAAESVAMSTALGHLERALALWDEHGPEDRAERLRRMWDAAELASVTGNNPRSVELALAALALGDPPLGAAWGYERLARYQWGTGDLAASAASYTTAADLLEHDTTTGPHRARTFAGLAQAALASCHFDRMEHWARRALDELAPGDDAARSMALRVLGLVASHNGEAHDALALCREAVEIAPAPHRRALAHAYYVMALVEAGCVEDAAKTAEDALAHAQSTGLEGSFGAYAAGQAVESLTRLGRWDEAEAVSVAPAAMEAIPVGTVQLAASTALLRARRGDLDGARPLVDLAREQSVDEWHQAVIATVSAEVFLACRDWAAAAAALAPDQDPRAACAAARWPTRAAALAVWAEVELALDRVARREQVDVHAIERGLRKRLADSATPGAESADAVGEVYRVFAEAALTRLQAPDPEPWAAAVAAARRLGDPWIETTALVHEADAAALTGAAARAADALRQAHTRATELGARLLLDEVAQVATRARISVEAAAAPVLEEADIHRLGLTAREAEVLSLVAVGKTNREIGEALYVSEKTASVHVSNILRKLGVASRVEAAAIAQRLGISAP